MYTIAGEVVAETEQVSAGLGGDAVLSGAGISLDGCVLDRTKIRYAAGLTIRAGRFDAVDAAGADMDHSTWRESLIAASRFTGAKLNNAYLEGVVFHARRMNLVQCQSSKLRRSRFDGCDLRGAYFNESDLTGTVFEGSDLTGADFSGAILNRCDIRRAIIEDIRMAPEQLDALVVTSDQALYLARLFGVDIQE